MPKHKTTLDNAVAEFRDCPISTSAIVLIETASQYWGDAIISDVTYAAYLKEVAAWLELD